MAYNNQQVEFSITDVIDYLGMQVSSNKGNKLLFDCPECKRTSNRKEKYHNKLCVFLDGDTFSCPRCGASGYKMDLISFVNDGIKDISELQARRSENIKIMEAYLGGGEAAQPDRSSKPHRARPKKADKPQGVKQEPIADPKWLDQTYRAVLSCMSLDTLHRNNLLNRGFTDEEIDRLGYVNTPKSQEEMESLKDEILGTLNTNGFLYEGVPGFYTTKHNHARMVDMLPGIVLPMKDREGRIVRLQVRVDDSYRETHDISGKTRPLSSAGYYRGCSATELVHIAGFQDEKRPAFLTEGVFKGDMVASQLGVCAIALNGVNNQTGLKKALKEVEPSKVFMAFDRDDGENLNVFQARIQAEEILSEFKIPYHLVEWDHAYKGIDDYIAAFRNELM